MQVPKSQLAATIYASMALAKTENSDPQRQAEQIAQSLLSWFSIQQQGQGIDNFVVPDWLGDLSFQQQSVILLALRGPDGVPKHHVSKRVHIAYRGTVLRAAERGRFLEWGEQADTFMSMDVIADDNAWKGAVKSFFYVVDELPHHYVSHLAHAAQIISFKHPDEKMRRAWGYFYYKWCDDLHVEPEPETVMDRRLGDWGKARARLGLRGIPFAVEYGIPVDALDPVGCGCSSCREETVECVAVSMSDSEAAQLEDDNPFHPESPEGRAYDEAAGE